MFLRLRPNMAAINEYKKKEDRGPINDAMNLLLPLIYEILFRYILK